MSLFDLKSLVSSHEDFADAHEPLNDGVKAVPNAKTVAASIGTGDVGKDTTSQGPAKVVPQKADTDEVTKTEHNVVKESAEKKGSTPAEAPAAEPAKPKEEGADKPTGDKAPPFTPKGETEETELEHTSEKAAKDDLEKTEKAKEALEAYAPRAKRFDIIGHPVRQAEQIGKAIGFVQRRSGLKTEVTVSAESIDNAIALSQTRLAKLEREVRILSQPKASTEDISDSMGIDNPTIVEEIAVTEAPTEHGAPPMDPAAAAALTEAELDPLDVPMLEIQRVQETLGVLETGRVAIEQYCQIVRDNPRMSKQAAAVLHAGLEHIDQVCGLKSRTTGFESYLTTPRAAMEETVVNEKSLMDRANEIGAKIIKLLKHLMAQAKSYWAKLSSGSAQLLTKIDELERAASAAKGTPTSEKINIKSVRGDMFLDGEFVGDHITSEEADLVRAMLNNANFIRKEGVVPILAALRNGKADTEHVFDRLHGAGDDILKLPGGHSVERKGIEMHWVQGDNQPPQGQVEIELPGLSVVRSRVAGLKKYVESLHSDVTIKRLEANNEEILNAVINYRKADPADVSQFQSLQSEIIKNLIEPFKPEDYLNIVKNLINMASGRVVVLNHMASSYK